MNKIIEIKTIINNCFISMEDYAQSTYLYFTRPELINEPDEIKWALLAFAEYVDDVAKLIEEYELEYDNLLKAKKIENEQIDYVKLIELGLKSNNCLRKLKTCAEDSYKCYMGHYNNKTKDLLGKLLEVPKIINMIKKILDKIEAIYESEMEGYCYEQL